MQGQLHRGSRIHVPLLTELFANQNLYVFPLYLQLFFYVLVDYKDPLLVLIRGYVSNVVCLSLRTRTLTKSSKDAIFVETR